MSMFQKASVTNAGVPGVGLTEFGALIGRFF